MQYIIFGCGSTGRTALALLGWNRVRYFASSRQKKTAERARFVDGKKVISFEEMLRLARSEEYIIVVASAKSDTEMCQMLDDAGFSRYFVYHETDKALLEDFYPSYYLNGAAEIVSYNRILSLNHISAYKRIAIYGDNKCLPYLISEVSFQSGYESIAGIVPTTSARDRRNLGLPLRTLDDAWDEIDCLIVNARRNESAVYELLEEREHSFAVIELYEPDRFEPAFYHPELEKYHNIHKGRRVFLVGNGPSVRWEDLEKLRAHNEISFGFNMVFRAFDQTKWRPTYLGLSDYLAFMESEDEIPDLTMPIFATDFNHCYLPKVPTGKVEYVHCLLEEFYPNRPAFMPDITYGVYNGAAVVYVIGMQFAAYMGASEIYLIGVDCTDNGIGDHFIKDYIKTAPTLERIEEFDMMIAQDGIQLPVIEKMTKAYEAAEAYSRKHGFRIYNATRGGELEVFERVDFDSLF